MSSEDNQTHHYMSSRKAFDGMHPRTELRELENTPSPQHGKDVDTQIHQLMETHQSPPLSGSDDSMPTTESAEMYPPPELPTKMEEAEDLAQRLGVALEELPEKLMAMKADMDNRIREIQKFTETFKTKPKNRAMRRAQKFNHSRLHY